jgi:NADP-dependent aldehyde dehydrogenase
MGSLNPVVLVDVTAGQATGWAKQLAASVTLGWGQFCTKPGIIAVPLTVADEFTTAMRNALGGAEPGWALTAGIASAYLRKLEETAGLLIDRTWVSPVIGTGHAMPAAMAVATVEQLVAHRGLAEEHFGPFALVVTHDGLADIARIMAHLQGSLTGTLITGRPAAPAASEVIEVLSRHVGRIIVNGVPTGVVVTAAQMHGAPYPSSTSPAHTSVGTAAIRRFLRPVAYQDVPNELLPPSLAAANPLGMPRTIDGRHEHSAEPSSARAAEARTDPEHPADTEREDE